jgi:transposase
MLKYYKKTEGQAPLDKIRCLFGDLVIADSIEPERIARILSRSPKSIENWFRIYIEKGIDALNSFQYQPKQSYLDEDRIDRVCEWGEAEENLSATKEITGFIFEELGVRYRTESVRKILKKRGFKFMEPKVVPGNPLHRRRAEGIYRQHRTGQIFNEIFPNLNSIAVDLAGSP